MDGCDLNREGGFLLRGWRRAKQNTAAACQKARQRRDQLNENVRVLAKTDEAFMASLALGFSSVLEEQGTPATSKGGGGVGSSR